MSVNGFLFRYWRYLLILLCGCAIITGQSCASQSRSGGPGSPLLIITSARSSHMSAVGATISWSTNKPADSVVEFGANTNYGNQTSLKTMETNHSVTLFGLNAETVYHFRVKSKDEAGNQSTSGDQSFTTLKSGSPSPSPTPGPAPTPAPPGFPVIATFSASPSTISSGQSSTLSWSVSGATALKLDPGAINVT